MSVAGVLISRAIPPTAMSHEDPSCSAAISESYPSDGFSSFNVLSKGVVISYASDELVQAAKLEAMQLTIQKQARAAAEAAERCPSEPLDLTRRKYENAISAKRRPTVELGGVDKFRSLVVPPEVSTSGDARYSTSTLVLAGERQDYQRPKAQSGPFTSTGVNVGFHSLTEEDLESETIAANKGKKGMNATGRSSISRPASAAAPIRPSTRGLNRSMSTTTEVRGSMSAKKPETVSAQLRKSVAAVPYVAVKLNLGDGIPPNALATQSQTLETALEELSGSLLMHQTARIIDSGAHSSNDALVMSSGKGAKFSSCGDAGSLATVGAMAQPTYRGKNIVMKADVIPLVKAEEEDLMAGYTGKRTLRHSETESLAPRPSQVSSSGQAPRGKGPAGHRAAQARSSPSGKAESEGGAAKAELPPQPKAPGSGAAGTSGSGASAAASKEPAPSTSEPTSGSGAAAAAAPAEKGKGSDHKAKPSLDGTASDAANPSTTSATTLPTSANASTTAASTSTPRVSEGAAAAPPPRPSVEGGASVQTGVHSTRSSTRGAETPLASTSASTKSSTRIGEADEKLGSQPSPGTTPQASRGSTSSARSSIGMGEMDEKEGPQLSEGTVPQASRGSTSSARSSTGIGEVGEKEGSQHSRGTTPQASRGSTSSVSAARSSSGMGEMVEKEGSQHSRGTTPQASRGSTSSFSAARSSSGMGEMDEKEGAQPSRGAAPQASRGSTSSARSSTGIGEVDEKEGPQPSQGAALHVSRGSISSVSRSSPSAPDRIASMCVASRGDEAATAAPAAPLSLALQKMDNPTAGGVQPIILGNGPPNARTNPYLASTAAASTLKGQSFAAATRGARARGSGSISAPLGRQRAASASRRRPHSAMPQGSSHGFTAAYIEPLAAPFTGAFTALGCAPLVAKSRVRPGSARPASAGPSGPGLGEGSRYQAVDQEERTALLTSAYLATTKQSARCRLGADGRLVPTSHTSPTSPGSEAPVSEAQKREKLRNCVVAYTMAQAMKSLNPEADAAGGGGGLLALPAAGQIPQSPQATPLPPRRPMSAIVRSSQLRPQSAHTAISPYALPDDVSKPHLTHMLSGTGVYSSRLRPPSAGVWAGRPMQVMEEEGIDEVVEEEEV